MTSTTKLVVAMAVALVSLASVSASAQEPCAEGRERSSHTAGRCCWPGQSWARDLGRCEGPPQCPAGLTAEGDSCVAPRGAVTPTPPPPTTTTVPQGPIIRPVSPMPTPMTPPVTTARLRPMVPTGSGITAITQPPVDLGPAEWPTAPSGGPDGLRNPHWVSSENEEGVIIAGAVVFGLGYVEQLAMAIGMAGSDTGLYISDSSNEGGRFQYYSASASIYRYPIGDRTTGRQVGVYEDYTCRNQIAGTLFVPIVGTIIAAAIQNSCSVVEYHYSPGTHDVYPYSSHRDGNGGWIAGAIPGAILQLIGLIMIPYGLVHHPRDVHFDSAGLSLDLGGTRLALSDGAPDADRGGLSLRLDF